MNYSQKVLMIGGLMAMASGNQWPGVGMGRLTTPDNGKCLIDWHDPEKIEKAKQKRERKKMKRRYDALRLRL